MFYSARLHPCGRLSHAASTYLCRMWCLWIFTIPSLRARDCSAAEKDALNLLFLGIPLVNITLPLVSIFLAWSGSHSSRTAIMEPHDSRVPLSMLVALLQVWKSFPLIYTVDCIVMASVYSWKLWLPALEERQK